MGVQFKLHTGVVYHFTHSLICTRRRQYTDRVGKANPCDAQLAHVTCKGRHKGDIGPGGVFEPDGDLKSSVMGVGDAGGEIFYDPRFVLVQLGIDKDIGDGRADMDDIRPATDGFLDIVEDGTIPYGNFCVFPDIHDRLQRFNFGIPDRGDAGLNLMYTSRIENCCNLKLLLL